MRIWVDADACPRAIKDILFRAAERVPIEVVLVANQPIAVPRSRWIRCRTVARGFDVADEHIAGEVEAGDLVITADIPLAAAVVAKGATVIEPRGERIDASNAAARLTLRDFMEEVRLSGELLGGPPPLGERDKRRFANTLDQELAKRRRG